MFLLWFEIFEGHRPKTYPRQNKDFLIDLESNIGFTKELSIFQHD